MAVPRSLHICNLKTQGAAVHAARRLRYEFWASQAFEKPSNSQPRSGNTHIGDEHVHIFRAGATFLQLDSHICWIRESDAVHPNMQPLAHGIPLQALSPQGPAGCAQRTSIRRALAAYRRMKLTSCYAFAENTNSYNHTNSRRPPNPNRNIIVFLRESLCFSSPECVGLRA